ncbi:carbohydrate kinase family protein [Chloroflexus aggregans]|uniref:PfkB domain protein n=1 Tax=Chloroflexus aggregans (strain MD-66 / DSM 9485) TaxID=326427 RepID=B8G9P7_CHLAD|nr:carbohydrate kinase family protein [Chloroflexus aggregans]ACL26400.1 PfkB domain protein [Chloroflexus aggregans DSM 9485]
MKIVVTGSLAFDYIMDFPGYFKDFMLSDKAHILSVSFLVDSMRKMRGGVAGNIAYNLSLLGERPLIVGSAGHDFDAYRDWLEEQGVDTSGITIIEHEFTSSCFINTDKANNQIVAFYAGAMSHDHHNSLLNLGLTADDLVLISPTNPDAMRRFALECRQMGVPYIFDPGKQTPRLDADLLEVGLRGAQVLIGNDYEFGMMAKCLELSEDELIGRAPITVVTRGVNGSHIFVDGQLAADIPVAPVEEVRDPTGAGDAYLAGIAFGLVHRLSWEMTGRIAALCAAYAIEERGCQEHRFTLPQFAARYRAAFGRDLPLDIFSLREAV